MKQLSKSVPSGGKSALSFAAEKIDFWGVYPEDDFTLILRTRLKSAEQILGFADKCCCEVEILEKRGVPIEEKNLKNVMFYGRCLWFFLRYWLPPLFLSGKSI